MLDRLVGERLEPSLIDRLLVLVDSSRGRELSSVGVLVVVRRKHARDGLGTAKKRASAGELSLRPAMAGRQTARAGDQKD